MSGADADVLGTELSFVSGFENGPRNIWPCFTAADGHTFKAHSDFFYTNADFWNLAVCDSCPKCKYVIVISTFGEIGGVHAQAASQAESRDQRNSMAALEPSHWKSANIQTDYCSTNRVRDISRKKKTKHLHFGHS